MLMPTFLVRDGTSFAAGAKQILIACAHGWTARLLLPGRRPLPEDVLRDLMIAIHTTEKKCACADQLRQHALAN